MDGLCDMAFEDDVEARVVGVDVFGELGGGNDYVGRMQFGHEQDVARRLGPDERQQRRCLCLLVMRNYAIGQGGDVADLSADGRDREVAPESRERTEDGHPGWFRDHGSDGMDVAISSQK